MDFFRFLYTKVSQLNLSHLLVLGLVIKAIVSDISIPTFLISIPVLAYEGYKLYLKSKKPEPVQINEAIMKRLDAHKEDVEAIKAKLTAQTMEKNLKSPIPRYF